MKTRLDIINEYYVNRSDIIRLLKISRKKASELYDAVEVQEKQKRFRPHEGKVPLMDVLKIADINYQFLLKQIKESEAR